MARGRGFQRARSKRCEMPLEAWILAVARPKLAAMSNCNFGRSGHAIYDADRSRQDCFVVLTGSLLTWSWSSIYQAEQRMAQVRRRPRVRVPAKIHFIVVHTVT